MERDASAPLSEATYKKWIRKLYKKNRKITVKIETLQT
jgi:hypothetical protein